MAGNLHAPTRVRPPSELTILGLFSGTVLLAVALLRQFKYRDFDVFYISGTQFLRGESPYAGVGILNTSPPHVIALMAPLTALPNATAIWVWRAISLGLFGWAIWRVHQRAPLTIRFWAALLACSGTFYQIAGGQVAWTLAALTTASWLAGPGFLCGLLMGVAASWKIFLGLFGLYFVLRREWLSVFGMALGFVGAMDIGILSLGVNVYRSWVHALALLNTATHPSNGSLFGPFTRLAQVDGLALISTGTARTLWLTASGVLLLLTWRSLQALKDRDREWALVLITALLVSPLGQPYYLLLGIGPLWASLRAMRWPRWAFLLIGLFWWPNVLVSPETPKHLWQLLTYGLSTVAMIALWGILTTEKRIIAL